MFNLKTFILVFITAVILNACGGNYLSHTGASARSGVKISSVIPYSPADQARIAPGDFINEVSQVPVSTPEQVYALFKQARDDGRKSVLLLLESPRGDMYFRAVNSAIGLDGLSFKSPN